MMETDYRVSNATDGNSIFLRAARAGNLEKVLEYLKGNIDINTSNANGLNALHLASKEGHVNVVTELLNRGANIDAATKKGNTALHIASLAGQEEIVKILVQHGAKVNVQSQNGFTPLYMAAQENHAEVVKFLLANGASQALTTEDGFSPMAVALQQGHDKVVTVLLEHDSRSRVRLPALHIAAKKNDVKAATLLLQNEHNVDGASKSGFTPLHIAAHYGNVNVGSLLIEKGADVNFKARNNITPLHVSSKWGRTNMVNLLVDNNANNACVTRDGLTPLHCGARSGHDQVVDILLEKGAPVTAKTKNGLTPLHMAAQGDHAGCARFLLYHKAPIDEVTVDYLTPLHVAAHCGNVKTAKLLLDKKCQVNARALNGFTPLHIACKKNRIKVVELLLKYMANLEATTESGLTPLHVSSFMGHMNIVVLLIQHGANTDCQTVRGETALHLAARANQTDIIRILLRNGASVDAKAREEQTPLHIASRLGNVDNVVLLLQHGASPNAATKDLYTPLHIAAKEGHEEVASVLLDHGADSSLTTKKGFTPLHIAAKYGNIKVARLLLQKEADPNAQGKNGLTPLHVATHYNHPQVALLLLENKAVPHAKAKNGYTPLHIAAKKNQMEIATTLLEYNAEPNAESKNGFTPLHLATQEGHTDMVSLLLEHKADVNFRAKNGLTPMHLAAQEDHVPVAEILVKYHSEIDPQTKAGYTPLHTACHFGQINMIRFLLDHGASVTATTKLGYTPLHQAAQQGHVLVINLLMKYKADPNAMTNNGQTPLSIAQRLGYISVVEVLKNVTEVSATPAGDEKYKVQSPETMQETLMTDSEDEGGDDTLVGDQSYQYLSTDDMKFLHDDSISPIKDDRDLHFFDRSSTASSMYGPERYSTRSSSYMQEELRYTKGDDSTLPRDELKYSQDTADFPTTPVGEYPPVFERIESVAEEEKLQSAAAPPTYAAYPSKTISEDSRGPMYGSSYSGVSFASSFDPDNIAIDRHPVYSGFLVSFMVDARGGAMRGCRHSGVRIIVPPGKACAPTRVTCKLVKREKLVNPPPLMEGEALASRVLEMGPNGAKFQGPVIIEVPHFASLRGKEREIVILRSDNGETWREHTLEATEDAITEALNGSFEDLESAEELYQKRITRILTTDFPQYFAIVTRVRQENNTIGPEGGMLSSTVVPQVQAVFPDGSLTKKIKVGLQAQPIQPEVVSKLLGNRVAVSPIVTVEPRRRKFHKPITLTIPLPKASQKGMLNQYDKGGDSTPTLRLLCSITGTTAPAQWEDITGTTVLTFVDDCVTFTTTVSARFWLMDCQNVPNCARMASELYREAIAVPFMSKFVVFAKRHDSLEARLRVFCMTDDKMDKTLENQEHFAEVARSRDVEVQEGKPQYIEMGGNLVPVTKSGEQLYVNFHAFRENRLPFVVRIRDSNLDPVGRVAFMREPKVARGEPPQQPICNLNITLPEYTKGEPILDGLDQDDLQKKYDAMRSGAPAEDSISRAELRLTDIAESLKGDWVALARQLGITEDEILKIQSEYTYPSEQALVMLHLWVQKNNNHATGNELERALKKIGREDVIRKCMYNVEAVTDEVEQAVARNQLDTNTAFDDLKEELGPSRDSSLRREESLDVHIDEQDLMKEAESAGETGSETGSLGIEQEGDRIETHSPVSEEPVAETKQETDIDDLIERVEGINVEGMDDRYTNRRLSDSSDDSVKAKDKSSSEPFEDEPDYDRSKNVTPPPSPVEPGVAPLSPTGKDVAAKLVEEQIISSTSSKPSEAAPTVGNEDTEGKQYDEWAQQKASEPSILAAKIQPEQATFQQTTFEDWAEQKELAMEVRLQKQQAPGEEALPAQPSVLDEITGASDPASARLGDERSIEQPAQKDLIDQSPADEHILPSQGVISADTQFEGYEAPAITTEKQEIQFEKSPGFEQMPSETSLAEPAKPVYSLDEYKDEVGLPKQELSYEPKSPSEQAPPESIAPVLAAPVESGFGQEMYQERAPEGQEYQPYIEEASPESDQKPIEEQVEEFKEPQVQATPQPEPVHEVTEGDIQTKESVTETEETTEEGITIRTKTTTVKHFKPIKDTTIVDGQVTNVVETEEVIGVEVEEDVTELPPGVIEPYGENLQTEQSVEEFEQSLPDGTWERKKIIKTTVTIIGEQTPGTDQKQQQPIEEEVTEFKEPQVESAPQPEPVHEVTEGDIQTKESTTEKEETTEEGITIRTRTTTIKHFKPIKDTTRVDGQVTNVVETEEVIGVEIQEDVMELPPGVDEPYGENLQTETSVEEFEESLPDGTWERKTISKTTVSRTEETQPPADLEQRVSQMVSEAIEEAIPVASSVQETPKSPEEFPPGTRVDNFEEQLPDEIGSPADSDTERGGIRVYTDTVEGEPQVETDVQEFEETLPDGTIVKRKVIKTRQKQTIVKRVVMEGPETDLPASEEQAQEYLSQAFEPSYTKYTDTMEGEPESNTDIQEFEETLEDGTVVKRRVVTTTEQQLKTERTVLEGQDMPEFAAPVSSEPAGEAILDVDMDSEQPQTTGYNDFQEPFDDEVVVTQTTTVESAPSHEPITEDAISPDFKETSSTEPIIEPERYDAAQTAPPGGRLLEDYADQEENLGEASGTVAPQVESSATGHSSDGQDQWSSSVATEGDDVEDDGEMQTTRLVMKKQIHKKTIIRDGKEETIVTEDTHIEQDNEGPPELRDSMQVVVDQFMEGQGSLPPPSQDED